MAKGRPQRLPLGSMLAPSQTYWDASGKWSALRRQAGVFILCPQRERRFDKDPEGDELPKASTRNETLFFQLYYTWYGSVCEASKKCGGLLKNDLFRK